ncbi:MAG: HAMP domain-containing sensor histidine kinase [Lachnospiraceae bacterium]|nr:HAMP domain-containing sensor histidine kinase [Lachnospiraceae bacterium]
MREERKQTLWFWFTALIGVLCITCGWTAWQGAYQRAAYDSVSAFCGVLLEREPEMETSILSAVKEVSSADGSGKERQDFLESYGYSVRNFPPDFPETAEPMLFLSAVLFAGMLGSFRLSEQVMQKQKQKRIQELTRYLEQVNRNGAGTVLQTREDAFSHLQDEIYKTVTNLYQTREQAVAAKKRFAENLANIAHQLKTPITSASLSLQLMNQEAPGAYGGAIEKQLKRLNVLEEALLTLSRIDAGALTLERRKVDLYTVLTLAAENLNDLLEAGRVSVSIPDRGCVDFTGDMEWTMEALMNLMKNCMEHSRPGGTVYCDYSGNPLYAEIRIWDEGEGFEPDEIPHLFERFYRGRSASGHGIGIGLSLARSILEQQNGVISARNLPEGGACFEIRLYRH